METKIASLMNLLEIDPWRAEVGFCPELQSTLDGCIRTESVANIAASFNEWISKHQPCLFGRIAAKQSAITYCIITERMLYGDEADLSRHIQDARLKWTFDGFKGNSSNFIIAVLSAKLASALPNETVKRIALRLCSLYLQEDILPDRIYLDRLYLELPSRSQATWEWPVGVNYFSAQGDKRWWQDHRFPAGMAFSMNSVGHMVKSGKLRHAIQELENTMGVQDELYKASHVDSLEKALGLAMRTIHRASNAVSGKATFLMPREKREATCPISLPADVSEMDYCRYRGFYHTDYTVPSEYFMAGVLRPADLEAKDLDFTYLFDANLDNPDYDRIGEGRRIRQAYTQMDTEVPREIYAAFKRLRGVPNEIRVADAPRLLEALRLAQD